MSKDKTETATRIDELVVKADRDGKLDIVYTADMLKKTKAIEDALHFLLDYENVLSKPKRVEPSVEFVDLWQSFYKYYGSNVVDIIELHKLPDELIGLVALDGRKNKHHLLMHILDEKDRFPKLDAKNKSDV